MLLFCGMSTNLERTPRASFAFAVIIECCTNVPIHDPQRSLSKNITYIQLTADIPTLFGKLENGIIR